MGDKKIQKKYLVNIFNNLKNINFISMSGRFLVFSIHYVIGPISYQKKYIKIVDLYISVKRALEKLHMHPQWGPDTHNSPQQRGAVSKSDQPLFCAKKHLKKTIKRFSISDLIKYITTSLVINYYI